jgi:hypothetical protein
MLIPNIWDHFYCHFIISPLPDLFIDSIVYQNDGYLGCCFVRYYLNFYLKNSYHGEINRHWIPSLAEHSIKLRTFKKFISRFDLFRFCHSGASKCSNPFTRTLFGTAVSFSTLYFHTCSPFVSISIRPLTQ